LDALAAGISDWRIGSFQPDRVAVVVLATELTGKGADLVLVAPEIAVLVGAGVVFMMKTGVMPSLNLFKLVSENAQIILVRVYQVSCGGKLGDSQRLIQRLENMRSIV